MTKSLKSDLLNEKICFACMKKRFTLFGSWGKRCYLCQRVTCSKCSNYMDVKDEHLNRVPVELLSPLLRRNNYQQTIDIEEPFPPRNKNKSVKCPRVCVDCQYFIIRASLD